MTFEQSKVNGTYFYGVDMNLLKNYNQKYYRDNYESGYFNQINSVADNFVIVNDEKLASVHSCFDLLNRVAMKSDPLSAYGQGRGFHSAGFAFKLRSFRSFFISRIS